MAEPVTLTSEERCRKAFEDWYADIKFEWLGFGLTSEIARSHYEFAWYSCWRYLERNAFSEFIEK